MENLSRRIELGKMYDRNLCARSLSLSLCLLSCCLSLFISFQSVHFFYINEDEDNKVMMLILMLGP